MEKAYFCLRRKTGEEETIHERVSSPKIREAVGGIARWGNPRPRMFAWTFREQGVRAPTVFDESNARWQIVGAREADRPGPRPPPRPRVLLTSSFVLGVSVLEGWRFDGFRFSPCVRPRKLRDILLGGRRTAGRLPRPPQHGKSTCARTHTNASFLPIAEWAQHAVGTNSGTFRNGKRSFRFCPGAPLELAGTGSSGRAKRPTVGDGKAAEDGEGGRPRGVREASGEAGEGPVEGA